MNLSNTYLRNGCYFTDLATYLCCSPFSFLSQWLRGCTTQVLAEEFTDPFQLISLSASAELIKLIPNWLMLLWMSVQTYQEEERPTVQSHSSPSKHCFSPTASVKERAQKHSWGSRKRVEQRTLNFESTLTAAERNTIMIWWGLGVFYY